MNANLPPGVSEKDLETDLHCAMPDESEEQARREDEAYERSIEQAWSAAEAQRDAREDR